MIDITDLFCSPYFNIDKTALNITQVNQEANPILRFDLQCLAFHKLSFKKQISLYLTTAHVRLTPPVNISKDLLIQ